MNFWKRKKKTIAIPEDCADFAIETDKSICTGEMIVGFRNPASGKLMYAELVKNEADVEAFKKKYGRG